MEPKRDWLGALSTDCICHRGKGWTCPIHGDVETAKRKLSETLGEPGAARANTGLVPEMALRELLTRWMKRGAGYLTIRCYNVADVINECMQDLEKCLSENATKSASSSGLPKAELIQEIKDLFARNDGGTLAEADIIDETLHRLLPSSSLASQTMGNRRR